MAVATSGHADPCSVDVLDFLFNNDDGILTQDGGFHPEEDGLQLPDLELVRHLAKFSLNFIVFRRFASLSNGCCVGLCCCEYGLC